MPRNFFLRRRPAKVFLTPGGSEAGPCTSAAPCKSFTRAYQVAAAGDIIDVGAGSYPIQYVPSGSKNVVFRGLAGNKLPYVLQGAVLLIAAIFLVVNLLVDLLYAVIDPRISLR